MRVDPISLVVANGASESGGVLDVQGQTIVGIYAPACTGTALTFKTSRTAAGTFVPISDGEGAARSYTLTASAQYIPLDPADYAGVQYLKIGTGSNEGAERTFYVVCRPVE
jgi:hypothetical protein